MISQQLVDRLISQSKPPERILLKSGIYFLIRRSQIIYVGQSIDVDARVWQHHQERKITFTSWNWTPCPVNDLPELEAYWILGLQPEFNKALPRNDRFLTEAQIRKASRLGIRHDALKKFLRDSGVTATEFMGLAYYDLEELAINPQFGELPICGVA